MPKRKPPIPPSPSSDAKITQADVDAVKKERLEKSRAGIPLSGPESHGRVTGAGKGQSYRLTPDGKKISTSDIVEQVRDLLITSTVGDIKRALARKFGGKSSNFSKHIALARKRNREAVSKPLEDTKAESIRTWSRSTQEVQPLKVAALKEMQRCQGLIDAAQLKLDNKLYADDDEHQAILVEREDARERFDIARKNYMTFDAQSARNQTTVDRIFGNHAAIVIDNKNTHSGSISVVAEQQEPLTHADADQQLLELFDKVLQLHDGSLDGLTPGAEVVIESRPVQQEQSASRPAHPVSSSSPDASPSDPTSQTDLLSEDDLIFELQ